ncbi:hypothetical protein AB6A40_010895 [Gnathostoma spinigerum]|uniref:Uncharacterized protein n=1 Tax=Gnathostoma spinigerum TaxID=75299 RepID=A0ABD6EWB7_9BILA
MSVLCCYCRRRRKKSTMRATDSQSEKSTADAMLAKLDEFESLAPLVATSSPTDETFSRLTVSLSHAIRSSSSSTDSPPPPRRMYNGKVVLVPLGGFNKGRSRFRSF